MFLVVAQVGVSPVANALGGQGWRQNGAGGPRLVAVTMHVRGKRPVSELAGALSDLDSVDAVVATGYAADE